MTATVGSLFAGVGGFDLGMEQAGFKVLWQAEWDKHCQGVLRRHWPNSTLYGDVTDVNGAEIPPVDVITFGSPCQDLSVAGKRAGLDGGRSSMFYEATRVIKEMRNATSSRPTGPLPRIAVWENVPGALSSNKGADFQSVIDEMVDVGAILVEWAVLDAQHFGVPQRRRRIFLVAVFDPSIAERCPDPLLPVREGRRGDFAKGRKKGQDVAGDVATSLDAGGLQPTVGCLTPGAHPGSYNGQDAYNDPLIPFVKARRAQNDTDDETWVEGEVTPTLNAFDNGGESRATVLMPIAYSIREDANANAQPIIFENSFRDGARINNGISPTLPAKMGTGGGNQPHVAQPIATADYAVRRLTPLECERLMGWRDDHTRWTDDGREQADSHRYRQCGNGVATPVAAWIGSHLLPLLEP